jgi:hypothetical protein
MVNAGIPPPFFTGWVGSFMSWPHYSAMDGRMDEPPSRFGRCAEKKTRSSLPGIEPRPARIPSLYRLNYRGGPSKKKDGLNLQPTSIQIQTECLFKQFQRCPKNVPKLWLQNSTFTDGASVTSRNQAEHLSRTPLALTNRVRRQTQYFIWASQSS